jgi:hypothetical protein
MTRQFAIGDDITPGTLLKKNLNTVFIATSHG